MENKEVVSIVIPIYNVEAYLKQCLETIVNQTYPNLEIILVNDGSPDNSEEICKEFFKRDSRIRYVRQVNGGLSAARNTGIDLATGDYITFVDPDDWVTEDYVETLYTQLKKYEADVSIANYNLFNESTSKFLIKVTENDYSETLYEGRDIIDQDAIQETRDMAWACAMMNSIKSPYLRTCVFLLEECRRQLPYV
ncbi:MAG: glycosyltransferase family 2 protein [Streptococcus salivarius]